MTNNAAKSEPMTAQIAKRIGAPTPEQVSDMIKQSARPSEPMTAVVNKHVTKQLGYKPIGDCNTFAQIYSWMGSVRNTHETHEMALRRCWDLATELAAPKTAELQQQSDMLAEALELTLKWLKAHEGNNSRTDDVVLSAETALDTYRAKRGG